MVCKTTLLDSARTQLLILKRISRITSSSLPLEKMLEELMALIAGVTASDACLTYLLDKDSGELVLCASRLPAGSGLERTRVRLGQSVARWMTQYQYPVALASHSLSDAPVRISSAIDVTEFDAFLGVPLMDAGNVIGAIHVHHTLPREHSGEEVAFLACIGETLGGVVARSQLMAENARLTQALSDRKAIERAKGILQKRTGGSEEQAYMELRAESRRRRKPMRELADAIIFSEEMRFPAAAREMHG